MGILATLSVPNPWQTLTFGQPPYVYAPDAQIIQRHNLRHPVGDKFHIYLDAYPEPYLGDPDAPILLLNRNPGYKVFDPGAHAHPTLAQMIQSNLLHHPLSFPFYPVSPTYAEHHKSTWWRQSLRHWIACYGEARVARAFFCVEFMPYHSPKYKSLGVTLPSQAYALSLVAAKLRAGAVVVIMRGESDWSRVLTAHGFNMRTAHVVRNHQTKSLSPQSRGRTGNLSATAASAVEQVLASMS